MVVQVRTTKENQSGPPADRRMERFERPKATVERKILMKQERRGTIEIIQISKKRITSCDRPRALIESSAANQKKRGAYHEKKTGEQS